MREMNQLVNTEDSAWPIIQNWLKDATNHTELLPVNKGKVRISRSFLPKLTR